MITLEFQKAVLMTYQFAFVSVRHPNLAGNNFKKKTTQLLIVVVCGSPISVPQLNSNTELALKLNNRSAISIRFSQVVKLQQKLFFIVFRCCDIIINNKIVNSLKMVYFPRIYTLQRIGISNTRHMYIYYLHLLYEMCYIVQLYYLPK